MKPLHLEPLHEFSHQFTLLKCPELEVMNYRTVHTIRPAEVTRKVWRDHWTQNGAHTQETLREVLCISHQQAKDTASFSADSLPYRTFLFSIRFHLRFRAFDSSKILIKIY